MVQRTRLSSSSSWIAACVSLVVLPHRWEASRISALPSVIQRYTGLGETPSTMRASKPARLNSALQKPPISAAPNAPVSGDLAPTAVREAPEMGRPVSTPGAKTSLFSGPRGSAPWGTSLSSTSATMFHPPM